MRPRFVLEALGLAASALLSTTLAACAAPGGAAAPPSSIAAQPAATAAPGATVAAAVSSAMAADALSGEQCQKSPDGTWTYTATLTNHGTAQSKFTVAVGLTKATAVLDHAMTEKTLAPGESAQLTISGFGKDAPSAGTDCGAAVSKERAE